MTAFHDLAGIAVFRPFDRTPPPDGSVYSPFTATWGDTVTLLVNELRHLEGQNVAVELGLRERDIRLDGMPRSDARTDRDAVRVSFDSKWGPLQYETGEFTDRYYTGQVGWQANIRAVALAMEALRKVDRYGVSKRGEQYRGWRQLMPSSDPADPIVTIDQARAVLDGYGSVTQAVKRTHPDTGGDPDAFRRVQKAREILGV